MPIKSLKLISKNLLEPHRYRINCYFSLYQGRIPLPPWRRQNVRGGHWLMLTRVALQYRLNGILLVYNYASCQVQVLMDNRALLLYLHRFFWLFGRWVFKAIATIETNVIVQLDDLISCFLQLVAGVVLVVLIGVKFIQLLVIQRHLLVVKLFFLLWLHNNGIRNFAHILVGQLVVFKNWLDWFLLLFCHFAVTDGAETVLGYW